MLYKGIIIEIKDEYSIVVTNESEFLRIKNKEGMNVGDKIYFLEEDLYNADESSIVYTEKEESQEKSNVIDFNEKKEKNKKKMSTVYKRLVTVAATIAIIVGTVTVSYTHLDVYKRQVITGSSIVSTARS